MYMYIYIHIYLIIIYVNAHVYRCMPWEGFLPVLKHMFGMCNWKSAPYTVGKHWAAKSVLHYRDPARCSWYKDEVRQDHTTYIAIRPPRHYTPRHPIIILPRTTI